MDMEKQQAINIITQVCNIYKGTLDEHKALQEALQVINGLVVPEPKEEKITKLD